MKLGIVGLPNVGKSTLFNALTNAGAESANYPFCTIEPNVGIVTVPDKRLDFLSDMHHPSKYTPAVIEFVDIAGLVKGASKGEGLGNQFLANIREVDAILHVIRCFEDDNIIHVDGKIDPMRDLETINLELIFADLEVLERRMDRTRKAMRADKKYGAELMREAERVILLNTVDSHWMDHIDAMDELRNGIGLRAYGQHDPVLEYRNEGYDMFNAMSDSIRTTTAKRLMSLQIREEQREMKRTKVAEESGTGEKTNTTVRGKGVVSKNALCPCGSGKKYKRCCGKDVN